MRKIAIIFLSLLIILSFIQGCSSCANITEPETITSTFVKKIGGTGADEGQSIIQLSDKTFMIAGKENISGNGDQGYIAHIETNGDVLWEKTYGGTGTEIFRDIFQVSGGFVAVGSRDGWIYVVKIDNNGTQQWDYYSSGTGNNDIGYAGCVDGSDIVVVGSTNGDKGCYILKLDSAGTKLFAKSFFTNSMTTGYDIIKAQDGNYYIAGSIATTNAGQQAMLLKANTSGSRIWSKFYGGSSDDFFKSIKQKTDQSFVLAGYSGGQSYIVRVDVDGNVIWNKTFGSTQYDDTVGISLTADGGIIGAGSTQSPSNGGWDFFLIRLDSYGTAKWTKNFGTTSDDRGYDVVQSSDYGFVAIGSSGGDIYIIKVDPLGNQ